MLRYVYFAFVLGGGGSTYSSHSSGYGGGGSTFHPGAPPAPFPSPSAPSDAGPAASASPATASSTSSSRPGVSRSYPLSVSIAGGGGSEAVAVRKAPKCWCRKCRQNARKWLQPRLSASMRASMISVSSTASAAVASHSLVSGSMPSAVAEVSTSSAPLRSSAPARSKRSKYSIAV